MITLSTPYEEMHRTLWEEFRKCEYWVQKHIKSERKTMKANMLGGCKRLDRVEYKGKTGNRWINYLYTVGTSITHGGIIQYDSVCYWETYASFGAFIPFRWDGERHIVITPSHFWQRVCERNGNTMKGVHTAMDFLDTYTECRKEVLPPEDGSNRRRIALHWSCGSGFGVEVSEEYHIFEIRTFIDKESMTGDKARRRENIMADAVGDDVKRHIQGVQMLVESGMASDAARALNMLDGNNMDKEKVQEIFANACTEDVDEKMGEFLKTMSEEEAIDKVLTIHTNIYVYDKLIDRNVEVEEMHIKRLAIRLRRGKMKEMCDIGWEKFVEFMYGEVIDARIKDISVERFKASDSVAAAEPLFKTMYQWGWISVYRWVMEEYYLGLRLNRHVIHLNNYKHGIYADLLGTYKEHNEKSIKKSPGYYNKYLEHCFAKGFDCGMDNAISIVKEMMKEYVMSN